jgi:hypothetical protein
MFLLFLMLMMIFFFPYLLIPFFAFFVLLAFLLPFKFTVDSLLHLFTIPSQIYQIATNPALRKNHALEHATAHVLEKEYGYRNLAGYAEENGFYIIGADNILVVEEAARKGLALMKRGAEDLAIHSKCGTSITVANFVSALVFLGLIFVTGHFSIINMLFAILFANLTGPLLGQYVQKYFTTSADVDEMEIVSSYYATRNLWNAPVKIFVKTTRIPYL